jgi:LysR family hydrogen peroxide-inducible transcriptional activator
MQGYAVSERQISNFSCSSISTLVAMIDMNLGVSFLPKIAIDFGVLSHYPNVVAESDCQASRGIGIVYRKNNYQVANIKKIAKGLLR